MSGHALVRHPGEALGLTSRAVALWRGRVGRTALLAAVDQARTSLNHERDTQVRCALSWVCRAVLDPDLGDDDAVVVDTALRFAAKALASAGPPPHTTEPGHGPGRRPRQRGDT